MSLKVVIPSRYASSRLPGKPLIDLNGLPMVVRVFEQVKKSLPNIECFVAIDDDRISSLLDQYDIPWVMTDVHHESGTDRIAEVCQSKGWSGDTLILNVQGDEPLIPCDMLSAFFKMINSDPGISMATISAPIESHSNLLDINTVKLICDQNHNAIYFSRLPIPCNRDKPVFDIDLSHYRRHIGVYAYNVDTLMRISNSKPVFIEENEMLEQLRALWLGIKIRVLHWTENPPHGVDTQEDVNRVNMILKGNTND